MCQGSARVSVQPSTGASIRGHVLRGSGTARGFIAQVESEGLMHSGRGVGTKNTASENRGAIRRECMSTATRDSGKRIRCYACGNFGHVAKACTMSDGSGWSRISLGNGPRLHGSSPRWAPAVMVGCTELATAALNTVTLQADKGVKEK
jgi:hypothetical protein